jgi:hypothetical protein
MTSNTVEQQACFDLNADINETEGPPKALFSSRLRRRETRYNNVLGHATSRTLVRP